MVLLQLNTTKIKTYNEIEKAEKDLEKAKQELQDGEKELNTKKQEAETKIADAENKLKEAKDKVNEIENPQWYILDRNSNEGYTGFIQSTKSIANISVICLTHLYSYHVLRMESRIKL